MWTWIDSRSNIPSACGCGCGSLVEIRILMPTQYYRIWTSLVSTFTAVTSVMHCTIFARGWFLEMCRFYNFFPASHLASCICIYVPIAKNFKFEFVQKTFRHAFHLRKSPCQRFCLMVTSQSIDWASAEWQYRGQFPTCRTQCTKVCNTDQKTKVSNARTEKCSARKVGTDSVLARIAFFMCMHCIQQIGNRP